MKMNCLFCAIYVRLSCAGISKLISANSIMAIFGLESYAAGVNPKQIPEMRAFDKKHGVPTDYSPDGDPVFRGPKHRRKYCEAHGLFDRNAGLSDPVPARCR